MAIKLFKSLGLVVGAINLAIAAYFFSHFGMAGLEHSWINLAIAAICITAHSA